MIKLDRSLETRDLERVPPDDLLHAARWWARGAAIMSELDGWRPHLAAVPQVALMMPDAPSLAVWLSHAHDAVRGTSPTSVYHQCFVELNMLNPPWHAASRIGDGIHLYDESRRKWVTDMCLVAARELLQEIRRDAASLPTPRLIL